MADEVDSLILEASVVDDFSDELDELETSLLEVEGTGEAVNPIDMDVQIGDALADIELIKQRLRSIQDEVNVDVDTEWEQAQIFGNMEADKGQMWEMFNFHENSRQTPTGGIWLPDREQGGNPFNLPDVGTADRGGNFRAAPGLLAEGASGDVAKDLVQAQARAAASMGGESRFDPLRDAIDDFKDLRLSMGFFMNILASLIPLLGVFVGALPAAIGGVMALAGAAIAAAGALYGLVGLGLLGMATTGGEFDFDKLRTEIQGLIDTFLSAFTPIADGIAPLMRDAFVGMEEVMFDVAMRMRQITSLTDDARGAMNGLFNVIGPALEQTVIFADTVMPLLMSMIAQLGDINLFGIMADMIAETVPLLWYMFSAIGRALPAIYELSRSFLVVATALTGVFSGFMQLLNVVPFLAEGFGLLIGLTLTAVTASALYSLAMSSVASRVLAVAAGVYKALIPSLYSAIAAEYSALTATLALTAGVSLLLGVLTFGLAPMLGSISSQFNILGDNISGAADELKNFDQISRRTSMPSGGNFQSTAQNGPKYSKPTSAYTQGSGNSSVQNTVVAPDKETGNAVANTLAFTQGKSKTDGDQVSDRQHGI